MTTSESRKLILPLKQRYFDQIRSGTKPFEYRLKNAYWSKRLVDREYDQVVFQAGYPAAGDHDRRIVAPYRGYIETEIVHEHFGDQSVAVFAILTPCHP